MIHIALVMAAFIAAVYMIPHLLKAAFILLEWIIVVALIGWVIVTVSNHNAQEQSRVGYTYTR